MGFPGPKGAAVSIQGGAPQSQGHRGGEGPGFWAQLCRCCAVWPQATHCPSLDLSPLFIAPDTATTALPLEINIVGICPSTPSQYTHGEGVVLLYNSYPQIWGVL